MAITNSDESVVCNLHSETILQLYDHIAFRAVVETISPHIIRPRPFSHLDHDDDDEKTLGRVAMFRGQGATKSS